MSRFRLFLIAILFLLLVPYFSHALEVPGAEVLDPGGTAISTGGSLTETIRAVAWRIFSLAKIILSGLALIYLVVLGVMMIVKADSPSDVKSQSMQILYTMVGFIFLNVPGTIYQIVVGTGTTGRAIADTPWKNTDSGSFVFLDMLFTTSFREGLINFISVMIFGIALVAFTWGIFTIMTAHSEESRMKEGRDRITWGSLGLISVAFLQAWIRILSVGELSGSGSIAGILGQLISLSLFLAGPTAIFFMTFGAYYMITSAGDEGRAKKGRAIVINTLVATLLLLGIFAFLNDLSNFTL